MQEDPGERSSIIPVAEVHHKVVVSGHLKSRCKDFERGDKRGDQVNGEVGAKVWDQMSGEAGSKVGEQVSGKVGVKVGDRVSGEAGSSSVFFDMSLFTVSSLFCYGGF